MFNFVPFGVSSSSSTLIPSAWNLLSSSEGIVGKAQQIEVATDGSHVAYEVSFISCTHNEGKSWESLFIPFDVNGSVGLSVTWWNRNRGLKGQTNVKLCSQKDYYDTVASKAVYKGYDVVAYVGRNRGFTRRHAFVEELASRQESSSPGLGISMNDHKALSSGATAAEYKDRIGQEMAAAIMNHPATSNFVGRLKGKGLLNEVMRESVGASVSAGSSTAVTFLETLSELSDAAVDISELGRIPSPSAKPKPPVQKADVYQSWGSFG